MLYSMRSRMSMFPLFPQIKNINFFKRAFVLFKTLALILRRSKIEYDKIAVNLDA